MWKYTSTRDPTRTLRTYQPAKRPPTPEQPTATRTIGIKLVASIQRYQ